jgi:hypothetical protein
MWNADCKGSPVPAPIVRNSIPELSQLWFAGLLSFGLTIVLSGCSTPDAAKLASPPSTPIADTKSHARAVLPKPKRKQELASSSTHEQEVSPQKVASIDPDGLIGLDPPSVEKMLGTPTNIDRGDPSIIWTYAGASCAFKVVFYPDIKTTTFRALKYFMSDNSGGSSDSSQPCIRNILTVRNNGPA